MLGKFITINGERFPNPNPETFSDAPNPIENKFITEAGTTVNNIVRLDKYSWSAEFNCTSSLRKRIHTLITSPSVVCTIDGEEYEGLLRASSSFSLVKNSENISNTNGLWTITLKFEQF